MKKRDTLKALQIPAVIAGLVAAEEDRIARRRLRQRDYVARRRADPGKLNRELKRRKQLYHRDRAADAAAHREKYRKLTTAERLYRSAKMRAKRQSVPFALTLGHLRQLWPDSGRCPVLGFRMMWDTEIDRAPSIDRLNRDEGYVPGNVRIISFRANRIKGDAHVSEVRRVLQYMESLQDARHTET